MPLGADHEQSARSFHLIMVHRNLGADHFGVRLRLQRDAHLEITAELNIGPAASHVGRNRNRAGRSGLRYNFRLLLVEARIQHVMLDLLLVQQG